MWPFSKLQDERYCAFCKTHRRVYLKKHVNMTNVLASVALASLITLVIYGEADPRGLIFIALFLVGGEIFVYLRWRMSLVCRMCGFDPLLYKKSPELAAARVGEFFKRQTENPSFYLTKSPLLELQRRLREGQRAALRRELLQQRTTASAPVATSASNSLAKNP